MSQRSKALEQKHKSYEPKAEYDMVWPSGEQVRSDRGSYIKCLQESPASYDSKLWQYHRFKNRNVNWWLERCEHDTKVVKDVLPMAIEEIYDWRLIDAKEKDSLLGMISSPDKENLYIALIAIIKYKADVRRLYKLNRHNHVQKRNE